MQGEQTHFWRSDDLETSFEALSATYITHSFARHTHEGFAIGVVERGAETFYYRGDNHVAPEGSIVVINPGELHTGQAVTEQGWSYRMLYPEAELLQRAATEAAGSLQPIPFFPHPVIRDPELFRSMLQMHYALESSPSALERETLLLSVLVQFVRRHADTRVALAAPTPDHSALEQAKSYLQTHFVENTSLEQLARLVHLSPFHLSRLFREQVGLPPHAYLNQVRVTRAKSLLRQGMPIAEVALRVGFADQSHLNKAFKRIVGVAPGQYSKIRQDR